MPAVVIQNSETKHDAVQAGPAAGFSRGHQSGAIERLNPWQVLNENSPTGK
jgi:hypothetical protein